MNIKKYILLAGTPLLFASTAMLTGCMDSEPMGSTVTSDQKKQNAEENPDRLEAGVAGIAANFSQYMANFSSQHSDFGYPSIMLHLEHRGVDLVSRDNGYNWFGYSYTYDNVNNTYRNDVEIWGTLYKQIFSANSVLQSVDSTSTDPQIQYYMAQALTFRAFDYFQLTQIYQKTYTQVDPTTTGTVPYITEANATTAASEGCPREPMDKMYEHILSDLTKAINLLDASGVKRSDKRYVNSSVAHGIRARVYLVLNQWANAAADAEYVINNSGATPKTLAETGVPSFNSIDENDWLWGIKIAETDDVVQSGIVNFPSHMGSLCYGYASAGCARGCNKKLYNSIPSSDRRKNWFCDANNVGATLTSEQQAYIDSYNGDPTASSFVPYLQVKYAPYKNVVGQSTNASDIPLMRIEEMYYIKAEAQAMAGNVQEGVNTLVNFVRTYRDPAYSFHASSGTDVQNEVFQQRRIELWGEGLIWFDYVRLNKDFDRRGGGFEALYCYDIPSNSYTAIWPIPYSEVQYNKQISEEQNNPSVSKPTAVADDEE